MKQVLSIFIVLTAIYSCGSSKKPKPFMGNKLDSVYVVYVLNGQPMGDHVLRIIKDTLSPDPSDPEKNIRKIDTFYQISIKTTAAKDSAGIKVPIFTDKERRVQKIDTLYYNIDKYFIIVATNKNFNHWKPGTK